VEKVESLSWKLKATISVQLLLNVTFPFKQMHYLLCCSNQPKQSRATSTLVGFIIIFSRNFLVVVVCTFLLLYSSVFCLTPNLVRRYHT
jgi:hypothetical protein